MAQRGNYKLASAQVLTASYVITSTQGATRVSGESQLSIEVTYTTGTGETASALIIKGETSPDGVNNWVNESLSTTTTAQEVATTWEGKLAGGAGATTYTCKFNLPMNAMFFRASVKETGVVTNFGTATINMITTGGELVFRNYK